MSTNTNSTTEAVPAKKIGRKTISIQWPAGEFSVKSIEDATGLSIVTIHKRLKQALLEKTIIKSGKGPSTSGRPPILFKATSPDVQVEQTPSPVVEKENSFA